MKRTFIAILGLASVGFLSLPAHADSLNISLNLGDAGVILPVEHVHYVPQPEVIVVRHDHDDYHHRHEYYRGHETYWRDARPAHIHYDNDYRRHGEWREHHGGYRQGDNHGYQHGPVINRVDTNPKLFR